MSLSSPAAALLCLVPWLGWLAGCGGAQPPPPLLPVVEGAGLSCPGVPLPSARPPDGTPVPSDKHEALRQAHAALDSAQQRESLEDISTAICTQRATLGEYQGVAEAQARHGTRSAQPLAPGVVLDGWLAEASRAMLGQEPWVPVLGTRDGTAVFFALRSACKLVAGYLAAAPLAGARQAELLAKAREGLGWLLSIQRPDGLFPFPDTSDDYAAFMADCTARGGSASECQSRVPRLFELGQRARQRWVELGSPPELLQEGWFTADLHGGRDGGLQFDNGVCGKALVAAYEALGEEAYLEAARAAGRWAAAQPVVTNWNYNGFSVGLLAALARVDPAGGWAAPALKKARLGVLPGALPDGRWYDPHNARIVYHHILLEDLALLEAVVDDAWLTATLQAAHQRSVLELTALGSTSEEEGLEAHLAARRVGLSPGDALRLLVNGAAPEGQVRVVSVIHWVREELAPGAP